MALSVSGFDSAVDYKLVYQSAASTAIPVVADTNVTTASGTLMSINVDNTSGTAACYLKVFDGEGATPGSSSPQFVFRVPQADAQRYEIPGGISFTNLNFWVTRNASPVDTTPPAVSGGDVKITAVTK
tara:strand:+ start:452 stop:835 length:384 start_codon:yes stop_codon:yes gene_type:complete